MILVHILLSEVGELSLYISLRKLKWAKLECQRELLIGVKYDNSRSYDALVGVVSHDYFHYLGARGVEHGLGRDEDRQRLRSLIINNYESHLQEIYIAAENEYFRWDEVSRLRLLNFLIIIHKNKKK